MSPSKPAENALLALGSDLGDRAGALARALALLAADPRTRVVAVSSLYATDPVGMGEAPEFLNAAAEVRTEREPEELLDLCQAIEAELGRKRDAGQRPGAARWAPRPIDLDLLAFGGRRLSGARLSLPHPRMTQRAFVLVPLAEIAPRWIIDGLPVAEWAARVGTAGVRRLSPFPGAGSDAVSPRPPMAFP